MKHIVRVLSAAVVLLTLGTVVAQDGVRGITPVSKLLELDGVQVGLPHAAGGGEPFSEVVTEVLGSDPVSRKHITAPKYLPIALQVDFDMEPALYQWIAQSWTPAVTRKNGSVHQLNRSFMGVTQRQFFNALITETTIPACDAASRDAAFLTVKLAPETTRDQASSANGRWAAKRRRGWGQRNFRLTIDGLDCTRVNKVDSFTVKRTFSPGQIGDDRDYSKEPGKVEFPNLKVTMSESSSQTWSDWFTDFVVQGNNGNDREKNGTLEFLSPDHQTVLGKVKFFNLGIFKYTPETADAKSCDCDLCETVVAGASSDNARRVTAHLYCERMEFVLQPPPIGD